MIPNTDRTKFLLLKQFYQFVDSTLANVSFPAFKIKQISFGVLVEHPPKNTGPSSREAFIRVKMVWFFCVSRGHLRATLFWPGPLRIQGYWPEWRPSTEVSFYPCIAQQCSLAWDRREIQECTIPVKLKNKNARV